MSYFRPFMVIALAATIVLAGCASTGAPSNASTAKPQKPRRGQAAPVRRVVTMLDNRPWISADAGGDRDPEGLQYRVFLDTETGKGVLRDGTFHVQMYRLKREPGKEVERVLASDWHYPTSEFSTVSANILGDGYQVKLRWHGKGEIPGSEVEVITTYESPEGQTVRSGTRRLRVPKYAG